MSWADEYGNPKWVKRLTKKVNAIGDHMTFDHNGNVIEGDDDSVSISGNSFVGNINTGNNNVDEGSFFNSFNGLFNGRSVSVSGSGNVISTGGNKTHIKSNGIELKANKRKRTIEITIDKHYEGHFNRYINERGDLVIEITGE